MRLRWRDFEFPTRVEIESGSARPNYAKFIVEPFERGFGHTLGNSLRRVLLSSLEGAAVTDVRIEGVQHEFSTISGVLEDVTEIILNIKKINLRIEGSEDRVLSLNVKGKKGESVEITAGDLTSDAHVEILNKDQVLMTLTDEIEIKADLSASKGRGFRIEDLNTDKDAAIGVIPVASSFSPVTRVRYQVSETRVGQMTNYDRLDIEIWTDGSITPEMALVEAAKVLRKHLNPFVQYGDIGKAIYSDSQRKNDVKALQKQEEDFRDFLMMPISQLGLSVRCANCLDSESINTVGELLQKTESYLLTVKNFGKTSLDELNGKLLEHANRLGRDIKLGMDVGDALATQS